MKILIFGSTGMVGHKILQILATHFPNQVYATLRGTKSRLEKFNFIPTSHFIDHLDVDKTNQVIDILDNLKPNYIINCTGITLRKVEHASIEKNYNINSYFPHILSIWCENHHAKVINFSTDCVFDGQGCDYTENDFPTARDVYGQSKFLGEVAGSHALTLRVPVIGREIFAKTELLEWFLAQKNKTIQGYSEVYYSGITTNLLAEEVIRIINEYPALTGLYQISSEKISKYDLLVLANQIFQNKTEIIKDNTKKYDKSLNCDKYISVTKFKKPQWETMLQALAKDPFQYERV